MSVKPIFLKKFVNFRIFFVSILTKNLKITDSFAKNSEFNLNLIRLTIMMYEKLFQFMEKIVKHTYFRYDFSYI